MRTHTPHFASCFECVKLPFRLFSTSEARFPMSQHVRPGPRCAGTPCCAGPAAVQVPPAVQVCLNTCALAPAVQVEPRHLDQLLHPQFADEEAYKSQVRAQPCNVLLRVVCTCADRLLGTANASMNHNIQPIDPLVSPLTNPWTPVCVCSRLKTIPTNAYLQTCAQVVGTGLPASPGAAVGQAVFSAEEAESWSAAGLKVCCCV